MLVNLGTQHDNTTGVYLTSTSPSALAFLGQSTEEGDIQREGDMYVASPHTHKSTLAYLSRRQKRGML